ncbi:MAG TPA: hypothetical protein VGJ05_04335 [Fimbriiglobus sp.]|jgi:hypothetical protein
MQLIVPDVLAEAKGLSAGAAGFGLLLGILLWLFGWRWHRFWVVFGVTLAAGLVGLNAGQAAGGQVLAVGVLLAVAAGMLALELARVLAFVAGGVAAWVAIQTMLPGARELWAVFLAGGLLGLLLYRFWAMLLTSFAGAVLAGHAGLALSHSLSGIDAVAFAATNSAALTGAVLVAALVGVFVQHRISLLDVADPTEEEERKKKKKKKRRDDDDDDEEDDEPKQFWRRAVA